MILIATGSEVSIALEAQPARRRRDPQPGGVDALLGVVRAATAVLSRPVLPPSVRARVSIEAAAPFGWERYVGLRARSSASPISAHRPRASGHARIWLHTRANRRDCEEDPGTLLISVFTARITRKSAFLFVGEKIFFFFFFFYR